MGMLGGMICPHVAAAPVRAAEKSAGYLSFFMAGMSTPPMAEASATQDPDTPANIMLAMVAGFILRRRLDYPNHILAALMIVVSFFLFAVFDYSIFLPFFLVFTVFGAIKDYADDVLQLSGWKYVLSESMLYYPIPTAVYGVLTGAWAPFIAFTAYTLAYDVTKLVYIRKGVV